MARILKKILNILKILIGIVLFAFLFEKFGFGYGILGLIIYSLLIAVYSILINWKYFKENYIFITRQTETVLFGKPIDEHNNRSEIKIRGFVWNKKKKK